MSSIEPARHAFMLVAALALLVTTLLVTPGIAEAQDIEGTSAEAGRHLNQDAYYVAASSRSASEPATRLVIRPGDSLWSISQKRLPSDASMAQIANEVERIFNANRDQIGNDPTLILPGQELVLPPVAEPDTNEPQASEPQANESAANESAASEPQASGLQASEPAANEPQVNGDVPNTEPAFEPSNRWLAGIGTLVLTFVLASLIAWRRPTGSGALVAYLPTRRDTEERGSEITMVHSSYYDLRPRFGSKAFPSNISDQDGIAEAVEGRQEKNSLVRTSGPRRKPPSRGWATGVHSPQVYRYLRRPPRRRGSKAVVPTKKPSDRGSP